MKNSDFLKKLDDFKAQSALVIGDLMLDRFISGDVNRISPESPVPVLKVTGEQRMLGGAGNVVRNLRSLGCQVNVIGLIGDDAEGENVVNELKNMDVSPDFLLRDTRKPTISKTRYVSKNHQLLRTDIEEISELDEELEQTAISHFQKLISQAQIVILSDYAKGMLSRNFIKEVIQTADQHNVKVIVDSKARDFSRYKGVYIVTPNKKELSEVTDESVLETDQDVENAAKKLSEMAAIDNVLVTRSEQGMSLITKEETMHFGATAREVFDVSGAGDTVIATLASGVSAGLDLKQSVFLANLAGGIVVEKTGTATIQISELKDTLESTDQKNTRQATICSWEEAEKQVGEWQVQGLKVGFTNGSFDILHSGHVRYLTEGRTHCDRLVVALNTDGSIKRYKSEDRPINGLEARAEVIASLSVVDLVVSFGDMPEEEDKPLKLISLLKPDYYFKGGDYTIESLPETPLVRGYGGEVDIINFVQGYSTTGTIEKLKAS